MAESATALREGKLVMEDDVQADTGYVLDKETGIRFPFYHAEVKVKGVEGGLGGLYDGMEVLYSIHTPTGYGTMTEMVKPVPAGYKGSGRGKDQSNEPKDAADATDNRSERVAVKIHKYGGEDKSGNDYWWGVTPDGIPVFISEIQLKGGLGDDYEINGNDIIEFDDSVSRDFCEEDGAGRFTGPVVYRGGKAVRYARGLTQASGEYKDTRFPDFPEDEKQDKKHDNGYSVPGTPKGDKDTSANGATGDKSNANAADGQIRPKSRRNTAVRRKTSYGPISKRISGKYDEVRQSLQPGDYEGELDSYKNELAQYKAIGTDNLSEGGKVDRQTDIDKTEKKVSELGKKVAAYNEGWFYHDFGEMRGRHDNSIPKKTPWGSKKKDKFANAVESALDEVNGFELEWSDTMTPQQRQDLEVYRKGLKKIRRTHDLRPFYKQLWDSMPW